MEKLRYREIQETAHIYIVQSWLKPGFKPRESCSRALVLATRLPQMQTLQGSEVRPIGVRKKEQKQMRDSGRA